MNSKQTQDIGVVSILNVRNAEKNIRNGGMPGILRKIPKTSFANKNDALVAVK